MASPNPEPFRPASTGTLADRFRRQTVALPPCPCQCYQNDMLPERPTAENG